MIIMIIMIIIKAVDNNGLHRKLTLAMNIFIRIGGWQYLN